MSNREKIIKGLETCIDRVPGKYICNECPYEIDGNYCERNLTKDAITLLKEQDETIKELQNAYDYLQKQFFEAQDKLLKEQKYL